MLLNEEGSVPEMFVQQTFRCCSCVMLDHADGKMPDTLVRKMYSVVSCDMLDHSGGSEPLRVGLSFK